MSYMGQSRQIIASANFEQVAKNVQPSSNVTETAAVMGECYPYAYFCPLEPLQKSCVKAYIIDKV
jgi:hypothetical protein